MDWIESRGGPLVLIPRDKKSWWRGTQRRPGEARTDYERACEVMDEVGLIEAADIEVLVLGDEPLRTAWHPTPTGGVFICWVYADSQELLEGFAATKAASVTLEDTGLAIELSEENILFDSADDGQATNTGISVKVAPGRYRVETGLVDVTRRTRCYLHRLTQDSSRF